MRFLSVEASNRLKRGISASVTEICKGVRWREEALELKALYGIECDKDGLCKKILFPTFWHSVNILTAFVTTVRLWREQQDAIQPGPAVVLQFTVAPAFCRENPKARKTGSSESEHNSFWATWQRFLQALQTPLQKSYLNILEAHGWIICCNDANLRAIAIDSDRAIVFFSSIVNHKSKKGFG